MKLINLMVILIFLSLENIYTSDKDSLEEMSQWAGLFESSSTGSNDYKYACFKLLGLDATKKPSEQDLKIAYKSSILKWHQDKNPERKEIANAISKCIVGAKLYFETQKTKEMTIFPQVPSQSTLDSVKQNFIKKFSVEKIAEEWFLVNSNSDYVIKFIQMFFEEKSLSKFSEVVYSDKLYDAICLKYKEIATLNKETVEQKLQEFTQRLRVKYESTRKFLLDNRDEINGDIRLIILEQASKGVAYNQYDIYEALLNSYKKILKKALQNNNFLSEKIELVIKQWIVDCKIKLDQAANQKYLINALELASCLD